MTLTRLKAEGFCWAHKVYSEPETQCVILESKKTQLLKYFAEITAFINYVSSDRWGKQNRFIFEFHFRKRFCSL